MDRPTTRREADADGSRVDPPGALVLPSRRPALDLCRLALSAHERDGSAPGPVLVTGEAGAGKTWLWRQMEPEAAGRWFGVDLTPTNDPRDFYRLIAHELGLDGTAGPNPATSRVGLVDFLAARLAEGERVGLVVEEAHNLSAEVWEEVRVLANRLDRPGGFAGMLLVGQTALAARFSTRPFAAIEARLAARVHLGPIDVAEAKQLLDHARPGRAWADEEVEALHRDASGNPRRLLRMVRQAPSPRRAARFVEPPAIVRPAPAELPKPAPAPEPIRAAQTSPLTGPDRPPIRVEENMIEVGWSPDDLATSQDEPAEGAPRRSSPTVPVQGGEEAVRDHYAALQAWREWAENQAGPAPKTAAPPSYMDDEDEIEDDEPELPAPVRPTVRAEGEQKFAPFGHLFSKMAQAIQPEP